MRHGISIFFAWLDGAFSVIIDREVMRLTADTVSGDVVAIRSGGALSPEQLQQAVRAALAGAGLTPWRDMEAEIYTYGEQTLAIARPAPPLTGRPAAAVRPRR
jgi:hypothetical protein